MTALSWAAFFGRKDVVEFLLSQPHVDVKLKALEGLHKGKTADQVAEAEGHEGIAARLREVKNDQLAQVMREQFNENVAFVKEFLKFAEIPDAHLDEYAGSLVRSARHRCYGRGRPVRFGDVPCRDDAQPRAVFQ